MNDETRKQVLVTVISNVRTMQAEARDESERERLQLELDAFQRDLDETLARLAK